MKFSLRKIVIVGLASQAVVAFQPGQNANAVNNINGNSQTSLPVAAPIQSEARSSKGNNRTKKHGLDKKPRKNNKNYRKDEKKEFAWLYWLYKQWGDSPVAHVEKSILQQFLPAAQSWKSKKSWLGAQRATELVERYCIEYLAGNEHAVLSVSSSQSYFAKLLRAGLDAWLHCADEPDPSLKAHQLLDNLMVMADRAILESNNDSETVARAKTLQTQIQDHRVVLQEKSLNNPSTTNNADPQISTLLYQSLSFMEGGTSRHLDDSLVAMQQVVVSLNKLVTKGSLELIEEFEREIVFSVPQQEQLLQSSEWLSVAVPYWEFLHHSLIRGLTNVNEHERAERGIQQMQDVLEKHQHLDASSVRNPKVAMQRILAIDDEGDDLLKMIKKDKQFQWLHWLSHQLSVSEVGEVGDAVLKLVMPAMSMHAKRKSKTDAEQAERLLNRYVEEFRAGNTKAVLTNNYFNCVCDAWARLGDPKRSQAILNELVQLQEEYPNDPKLKPDVISLSTLAAAWANNRSKESAKRAEEILHRMESDGMNPTTITYNTVLKALIHSPGVSKALRAEEIVKRMETRYEEGHKECKPSIRTYQSLISAWSRTDLSGTAQKGEQVLNFLDTKSQEKGFADLKPNAHCFAAAIHGWAFSKEEQKAKRAYNILSHMRDLYEEQGREDCKPNVVVYTAVVNACALPMLDSEKEDAFQIAQLAMDELCYNRRYGWPNFLTFAAFFRVIETTLEPGPARDDKVRTVFSKCCEAGQVAEVVIEKLKRAASTELYRELIVNTGAELQDGSLNLPRAWTRRVQGVKTRTKPAKRSPRRSGPEQGRVHEIRLLKGTAGHYSKGNSDEDVISISFEEGKF